MFWYLEVDIAILLHLKWLFQWARSRYLKQNQKTFSCILFNSNKIKFQYFTIVNINSTKTKTKRKNGKNNRGIWSLFHSFEYIIIVKNPVLNCWIFHKREKRWKEKKPKSTQTDFEMIFLSRTKMKSIHFSIILVLNEMIVWLPFNHSKPF